MGFEPTTSAMSIARSLTNQYPCFAGSAGMCSANMFSMKPLRKLKKERASRDNDMAH